MRAYMIAMRLPFLIALVVCAGAAAQETISISRDACSALATYEQPPGVEFEPGVTVDGDTVAPAELPSRNRLSLGDSFSVPIENLIPLGSGAGDPEASLRAKVIAGEVALVDGEVLFNGEPIQTPLELRLTEACRALLAGEKE